MLFTNRRYLCYFDWISLSIVIILSLISLCFIFSTTCKGDVVSLFLKKQCFGIVTGLGIYFLCSFIDYRTICRTGYWLYWCTIALLIFTLFKGSVGMGAQRWVNLGFVKFQSSDLAKLFFPMFITYYFLHDTDQGTQTDYVWFTTCNYHTKFLTDFKTTRSGNRTNFAGIRIGHALDYGPSCTIFYACRAICTCHCADIMAHFKTVSKKTYFSFYGTR